MQGENFDYEKGPILSMVPVLISVLLSLLWLLRAVVPSLGPPDVLGLQLPEILDNRGGGEGFWEL